MSSDSSLLTTQAPVQVRVKLSQSGSLLLDVVRFSAAYIVLVHHFLAMGFSEGLGNISNWGREAVCVFFVLSGFVIRFITVTRVGTLREYGIDRVSRIYSVVAPALLFTVFCEALSRAVHPGLYGLLGGDLRWSHVPAHVLANLTFTSQLWGYEIQALSNTSFWSLSFEVVYYVLYALVHYRVRYRWFWVALLLMVSGPNIALLFPTWLFGVWACDLYLALQRRRQGEWTAGMVFLACMAALFLLRHPVLGLIRATEFQKRTSWITNLVARQLAHNSLYNHLLFEGNIPWLSQCSVSFAVVGVLTAVFMLFGLLLLDRYHPTLPPAVTRTTRLVADSTFALYLFHLPLLLLLVVLIGHRISSPIQATVLLIGVPVLIFPVAVLTDRLKNWMRHSLHRAWERP